VTKKPVSKNYVYKKKLPFYATTQAEHQLTCKISSKLNDVQPLLPSVLVTLQVTLRN